MTMKVKTVSDRDDNWLLSRLDYIWTKHFEDIPQTNRVFIRFGRFARFRLGSIKFDKKTKDTIITMTGLFKNPAIPQAVVDHTIAHELVHYTHGFSSPNSRLFKYPHEGGVVRKEMSSRGMEYLFYGYKAWIKSHRKSLMRRYGQV